MFNNKLTHKQLQDRFYIKDRKPNFLPLDDLLGPTYQNLKNPPKAIHVASMPEFNRMTGGFRPREFSILCGSTGVGKTTFIANLSAEFLRNGVSHYVASVETGALDYTRRVISALSNSDINHGGVVPDNTLLSIHKRFGGTLKTDLLQLALYENRSKVEELKHDITAAHVDHGCQVAIIDNLNFFMEVTKAADSVLEMDRVIHEMVIFVKQIDVHVIMIMHPKKNQMNARDTRVESEYEIKGSALAVQEAHNVFLLNRPSQADIDANQCTIFDRDLKIAKMRRHGKCVGSRIIFSCANGVSYQEKGVIDP